MKELLKKALVLGLSAVLLTGCGSQYSETHNEIDTQSQDGPDQTTGITADEEVDLSDAVQIELSDEEITVDGEIISTDTEAAVFKANDIVYYEAGKDFTYGEGTSEDEHTKEEADAHTVVHITEPGTYALSGNLSAGQVAVDLGEEAEEDPEAVVTLVLNQVDIQCSVAPAVIFYQVYECGTTEEDAASKDVDTSAAGANVVIADGTENNISGSYVARIYKSVELNEAGTEVIDSKKLHKYDAAFYSKMSMNVNGGKEGTGVLNITAENEGLDSELHLAINGGNINITSGNDGINTNEDGISVTTINGGNLSIVVEGSTGEGDGIDSNGWLVINGGTVTAAACDKSMDAGIDSDMGIHLNGGKVLATGNMLDEISESSQQYVVFNIKGSQAAGKTYTIKNEAGESIAECTPENGFTCLVYSDETITDETYTLWLDDEQVAQSSKGAGMKGGPGGKMPGGKMPGGKERPEGMEPPEGGAFPEGMEPPEGEAFPEGMEPPEGMERPEDDKVPVMGKL